MNGIIYNNSDEFVIHRDYIEKFFRENEATIDDEETYDYVVKNDNDILTQVANMKDEYIGISIHPMDDCFYINQDLLEWIGE